LAADLMPAVSMARNRKVTDIGLAQSKSLYKNRNYGDRAHPEVYFIQFLLNRYYLKVG
jgi:hypothetical protein